MHSCFFFVFIYPYRFFFGVPKVQCPFVNCTISLIFSIESSNIRTDLHPIFNTVLWSNCFPPFWLCQVDLFASGQANFSHRKTTINSYFWTISFSMKNEKWRANRRMLPSSIVCGCLYVEEFTVYFSRYSVCAWMMAM